jgi:hypothetical protein
MFLPALGMIVAAAAQIDAAITTNAFRSASPAPEASLNFPWYGDLAGPISTWWSFTGLFLMIGFAAFARSTALRQSRSGQVGAWAAVLGAAVLVVANFLSAANADAMMADGISKVIVGLFAGATLLLGIGMTAAGVATVRSGAWIGVSRFVPLANGIWPFLVMALIPTPAMQVAIGVMAALQVALGAALIAEEA